MRSREGIVIEFIVFGIGKIYLGSLCMMAEYLLSIGDKAFALLGVACDGGAGNGQFQAQGKLNGGIDY